MIDPDAYADYETWKAKKLAGQIDISISTYNNEASALAMAWDSAVDTMSKEIGGDGTAYQADIEAIKKKNPYRAKGMTGAPPE